MFESYSKVMHDTQTLIKSHACLIYLLNLLIRSNMKKNSPFLFEFFKQENFKFVIYFTKLKIKSEVCTKKKNKKDMNLKTAVMA